MANNNIIKILSTKFSEDEAKALAGEIDQRIKKVALKPMVGESLANEFADNMPEPSDFGVLEPCEDDTAQYPKTNFIPPTWASEMKKDEPAMILLDEYRIENGKEWHNGKQ